MLETSTNGAGAAVEAAAAGREDRRAVGELGIGAGGRAAPAGVPDPELVERAKRRTFTARYKLEILEKAEACTRPGEIGELLRREGLYTSHLTAWRKQRKNGALKELGKPRGRKPADKRDAQIASLRRRAERAEAELVTAHRVIEIQGKCAARRLVVSPVQPGGTRRRFLGPMALPGSER
jgi:transposase